MYPFFNKQDDSLFSAFYQLSTQSCPQYLKIQICAYATQYTAVHNSFFTGVEEHVKLAPFNSQDVSKRSQYIDFCDKLCKCNEVQICQMMPIKLCIRALLSSRRSNQKKSKGLKLFINNVFFLSFIEFRHSGVFYLIIFI